MPQQRNPNPEPKPALNLKNESAKREQSEAAEKQIVKQEWNSQEIVNQEWNPQEIVKQGWNRRSPQSFHGHGTPRSAEF
jgi:hypothetical protein